MEVFNFEHRPIAGESYHYAPIRNEGFALNCKGCHSDKQRVFNGEIAVHFRGLEGLDKPIVWIFPTLVVCFDCGLTEFTVPERELQVLEQGSPVKGAVVLAEKVSPALGEVRIKSPPPGMNN
jgi:hypothetical protein